jgi:FixJ family two-component response regulator
MSEASQKSVVLAGTSPSIRDVLKDILTSYGVRMYACDPVGECSESFADESPSLMVVELDGDGTHELQSISEMKQQYPNTPVLVIVERGDIPKTVQDMKAGAISCLEKPIETEQLSTAVDELLDQADPRAIHEDPPLTPTEITVLGHILEGKTSRQIAKTLCRSPRTIEVHRSHIMHKLDVSTMVDLMRAASAMGLFDGP